MLHIFFIKHERAVIPPPQIVMKPKSLKAKGKRPPTNEDSYYLCEKTAAETLIQLINQHIYASE